ncbi:MAG: zinc-binding dehydrogenase [bacterium]|nr:zinc-binding dehydrogenase [bacterium]
MKVIQFKKHGGPDVLEYVEIDDLTPGRGEVVLRVRATSLNHLDLFVRRGIPGVKIPLPHVPGCDAAGEVLALGDGVTTLEQGERVLLNPSVTCGQCEFCLRGDTSMCRTFNVFGEDRWGGYAEQMVVPAENLVPIPDDMSNEDAASVPLVFMTAWRMLIGRGRVRPSEDVLILGAAAGVGIAAIQIAKVAGARVFAAASSDEKLALCGELGADVLINYEAENFVRRVREETGKRGVDVVVDYVGKDTWVDSLRSLTRGGRLLTCGATTGYDPTTDIRQIFYRQLEIIGSTMGSANDLNAALTLISSRKMKPVVGKVFELKEAADAHRLMETRNALGKIVRRPHGGPDD